MKTKKLFLCAIIALFIFAITSPVYANYQSVYNSEAKYLDAEHTTWISNIRNMEASGQVMGLTETKNADLTPTTSNNIDVHMLKNTEYGAVAILSASTQYGKQGEGTERYVINGKGLKTTTGNVYGVYFDRKSPSYEYTAAGGPRLAPTVNSRYKNEYTETNNTSIGDLKWHGNTNISVNVNIAAAKRRAYYGSSIFYSDSGYDSYAARAAIVCGIGF